MSLAVNLLISKNNGDMIVPVEDTRDYQFLIAVSEVYRWKHMRGFIKQYVQHCLICQQAKLEHVSYPGLLQPLPVPKLPWDMVTMDFVEDCLV